MKKRYRIEFTVDVDDEGYCSTNEFVKNMALQELTCMSPYPEDITFEEIGLVQKENTDGQDK